MYALRILVTLAILIPVWLIRQPHDTIEIFVIAFVAFGCGRLVEMLVRKRRQAKTSDQ